jgi:hypothetical protein
MRTAAIAILVMAISSAQPASVPDTAAILLPPRLITEPGFFEGALELSIQNRSEVAITAWGAAMKCPGERPVGRGFTRDAWSELERARRAGVRPDDDRGVVLAGETGAHKQLACGPKGRGTLPAEASLTVVILEDGRWAGDAATAAEIFARRVKDRAEWAEISSLVAHVRATTSGRDALLILKARLEPLAPPPAANAASGVLRNLRLALDDSRSQQQPPEIWLQSLNDEATFQIEASVRHLTPNPALPSVAGIPR